MTKKEVLQAVMAKTAQWHYAIRYALRCKQAAAMQKRAEGGGGYDPKVHSGNPTPLSDNSWMDRFADVMEEAKKPGNVPGLGRVHPSAGGFGFSEDFRRARQMADLPVGHPARNENVIDIVTSGENLGTTYNGSGDWNRYNVPFSSGYVYDTPPIAGMFHVPMWANGDPDKDIRTPRGWNTAARRMKWGPVDYQSGSRSRDGEVPNN